MSTEPTTDDALRIVLVVVAVVVLAPVLLMLVAMPMMGFMWGGGMMGGAGGSALWSLGIPLVWLVVLLGGGYLAYRGLAHGGARGADPALEELRLAYARGDISEEEFEQRRTRLRGE